MTLRPVLRRIALNTGLVDSGPFDFRTLHGTTDAPVQKRRRAFSTRWLGDDMVYCERAGETSPPLKDLGVKPGARMPSALFPVFAWDDTKSSA